MRYSNAATRMSLVKPMTESDVPDDGWFVTNVLGMRSSENHKKQTHARVQ